MNLGSYFESRLSGPKKVMMVYPGRFHPPGPHHLEVVSEISKKAEEISATPVVAMSAVSGEKKRPFNFAQRASMFRAAFPSLEILKMNGSMYSPESIMTPQQLSNTTYVVCVGEKDMSEEAPRLKVGKGSYFKKSFKLSQFTQLAVKQLLPASEAGYVLIIPNRTSGKSVLSSTEIRKLLATGNMSELKNKYSHFPAVFEVLERLSGTMQFEEGAGHHIHVEELLYDLDLPAVLDVLSEAIDQLKKVDGDSRVTLKVDGSPAFIVGKDEKSAFVAYKGALSAKTPVIFRTQADVNRQYGDRPEMLKKFSQLLKYLPKIIRGKGTFQGDFLFDSDDKKVSAEGVSFRPNTIEYVISRESSLYQSALKANIGVALHTRLEGTAGNFSSAGPCKDSDFIDSSSVFRMGVAISGVSLDSKKLKMIESSIELARKRLESLPKMTDKFRQLVERAVNLAIRDGLGPKEIAGKSIMDRLVRVLQKEKVSDATKQKKIEAARKEQQSLEMFMRSYSTVMSIKNDVIGMIDQALESMVSTLDGRHEGYVMKTGDRTVKLVDRQNFSRLNFMNSELKGLGK